MLRRLLAALPGLVLVTSLSSMMFLGPACSSPTTYAGDPPQFPEKSDLPSAPDTELAGFDSDGNLLSLGIDPGNLGDLGGSGSFADEQLLMGDGTTSVQGIPNWTGTGSVLEFDNGSENFYIDPENGLIYIEADVLGATYALDYRLNGDTFSVTRLGSGLLDFGDGSAPPDWTISRTAANVASLTAGDSLRWIGGTSDPSTPAEGQVFYRSDANELKVYNGSSWDVMNGSGYDPTAQDAVVDLTSVTATYTVLSGDQTLLCNSALMPFTITLPAASAVAGRRLVFKDRVGACASRNVTISRAGSDTIDGGTTVVINTNFGGYTLISDGATRWMVEY